MALVSAGIGVKHNDAMVAVTVGDENFVGRWIDFRVGRAAEPRGIGAAGLWAGLSDLQYEFSVLREFQHVAIIVAIAADPDETFVVDIDPVLALEPVVAFSGAAPGFEQVALLVKYQDRRRRHAALGARWIERRGLFIVGERAWPLDHPDMVLRIDCDTGGLTHDPVVWKRLRPRSIDLKFWQVIGERRRKRKHARKK